MSVTIKSGAPRVEGAERASEGNERAPEGTPLTPAAAVKTFSRAEPPGAGPRASRKSGKPKQKTKPRRPRQYDPAVMDAVLKAVAGGKTLTQACKDNPGFPDRSTVYAWIQADDELKARYDTAREFQLEFWADQLIDIPDAIQIGDYMGKLPDGTVVKLKTADKIKKASLQVEYRFKVLSRRSQDYTERQTITHAGRMDVTKRVIVVTGGLPRKPLGELPPEERDAAVREAAKTREITWDQINNPFGLDIAAIEAQRARMTSEEEREFDAEPSLSPTDLAVLARVSGNPADYDGEA